jgi:phosphatidylglycerol lysyltransferase
MSRNALRRWVPIVLPFLLLLFALVVLHRELRAYRLAQVLAELQTIPRRRLALSVVFTVGSFVSLTGYDWLATRYVGARIAYRRVAFASFLAYAFGQSVGLPLVTGGSVRYRLYSAWGLEAGDIARIIAFASATMWIGFMVLAGSTFLVDPPFLPDSVHFLGITARPVGGLLLALALAYYVWCSRSGALKERPLGSVLPPGLGVGLRQTLLSMADWLCSAAVLFVLLPAGSGLAFLPFLAAYLLAQVLGLLSSIPGGLGVFEIVLLLAVPDRAMDSAFVASLLAFRGVYYVVPLITAAGSLGVFEVLVRREKVERALGQLGTGLSSIVPVVSSGAVFVTGAILLVEGALPLENRLALLESWAPLALIEASHFIGSVVGACLIILAWGLARRLDGAFHATLALLGAAALTSAFRAGGVLTATVVLAVLIALAPTRREFFRKSTLFAEALSPEWVFGIAAVLLATTWLGFFAFREVAFSSDLWWQFALRSDASRFLRGSVGTATVLLAFALGRLLQTAEPIEAEPPLEPPPQVEEIARRSDRSHVHLAFLGDKSFLLSISGRSFIMFAVDGRSWVSMGDPIGDPEESGELVWEFLRRAHLAGGSPVFYQVRPDRLPIYIDAGLRLVKLGEEAVVNPAAFSLEGGHRKGMRYTLRKVEKEGGSFEIFEPDAVKHELPRLREISDSWLEHKRTREKGFSLGSFDERYIGRFPCAVVRVAGRVEAFANLWLAAPGTEYSIDLMRYDPERAPDDCMEYLFLKLIGWGRDQGYARFTLGMAPLAGLEQSPLAPLTARIGAAVYRYGERFYNFQGLHAYKDQFDPAWEPRYLATPGGVAFPGILARVSALVSGGFRGVLAR